MIDSLTQVAARYIGKQETQGKNEGPEIRKWKAMLGAGVLASVGIPWCAIFVAAVLMLRNNLNRRQLVAKLGFRPGSTFFESCDSWVGELIAHDENCRQSGRPGDCYIVTDPQPGDIFFMMEKNADGTYSKTKAHHTGFIVGERPHYFDTLEGNTVSGSIEGRASREGDGVYLRLRSVEMRFLFARLPSSLTGFGGR